MSNEVSWTLRHRNPNVLRWGYLVGGALYPGWHLFAPAQAFDPWAAWLLTGVYTVSVSLLVIRSRALEGWSHLLLLSCSGLITAHLFALAALNDLHPFFVTGGVLCSVHTALFERRRRALVAYAGWVALLILATYLVTQRPVIFAYGFSIEGILALTYWRLSVHLEIERISKQSRDALEGAVAARTQDLQQANEKLRSEIQERERLEHELLMAHKMEALGRLAGGVAHDYNNLLTTILGYVELLADRFPESSPERLEVEHVQSAARRAADLTGQLLAFSRESPLEKVVVDLNALLSELEPMLHRLVREDIELTLSLDSKLASIRANRSQLEQILWNLVINARDAMPAGGQIEIKTRDEHEGPQQWTVFRVGDTGHGMDAETRALIFDPFFTTKGPRHGTGLGLSTVYAIVQQAGGSIRVLSEPGRGSQFEIHWPATSEQAAQVELPTTLTPRGRERVLVVDDDNEVRGVVCRMLEKLGYVTDESESACDALLIASKAPFDLILTDVVMPQMSGLELAKQLQASEIQVPVLFMSGQLDHPSLRLGQLPEGAPLIAKPFTSRTLAVKVSETLGAGLR